MTFTSDADLYDLARRFLDLSLPKNEWTHEAHFGVALCLLADPNHDAFAEMPNFIRAYNTATGVENNDHEGYHETITLASLHVARSYLSDAPVHEALSALMRSKYSTSRWMLDHWSKDRLFSVEARKTWCPPDLKPLPR